MFEVGRIFVFGADRRRVKLIGFTGDRPIFEDWLTGYLYTAEGYSVQGDVIELWGCERVGEM